ncbi:MAG: T9SS type A sorting domain-containing protein [Bacteroidales bacterium]|nr:T9SS type A sorting domain-containing protein [Bacteroidales bacterium]
MKNKILILIPLFLLYGIKVPEKSVFTAPGKARAIKTADIDHDGDDDIILGHYLNSDNIGFTVILNDSLNFIVADSIIYYASNISFAIAKLNGNEEFDLVSSHACGKSSCISVIPDFYTEPINIIDYPIVQPCENLAIGDINHDGYNDILFASNSITNHWGIIYNNWAGGFLPPVYFNCTWQPLDFDCGYLNEDSLLDVIIPGSEIDIFFNSDTGFILYNTGPGSFSLEITDIDNDGDNDIVGIMGFVLYGIVIYENYSNDSIVGHEYIMVPFQIGPFKLCDLNNDSLPDFLAVDYPAFYILMNDGNLNFTGPDIYNLPINEGGAPACADFNLDGYMDIAIIQDDWANEISVLVIYYNDGTGHFTQDPPVGIGNPATGEKTITVSCFPNPFEDELQIEMCLTEKSVVSFEIYNTGGKKLHRSEKHLYGPGTQQVILTASQTGIVQPGLYFLTVDIDGKDFKTIKMLRK